jgi:UDP-N-acetylglucosamine--N-acetylmuramyl-(pentapeptide) pyrophosphoryl-undecaprenol N-acetylglucosamine transferase
MAHEPALGRGGHAHTGNPVRAAIRARRRALHAAGRLADEPSGLRRQPGRAAAVRWVPAAVAQLPRRPARPSGGPAGPARGYRTGREAYAAARRGAPRSPRSSTTCPPADRGAACRGARRCVLAGRYRGDRAARDLIPYAAAAGDHQSANAAPFDAGGAASVIAEAALDPGTLARHLAAILGDGDLAQAMSQAALALGRPDAGAALADLAEDLAEGVPR